MTSHSRNPRDLVDPGNLLSRLFKIPFGLIPLGHTPGSRFMPWIIGLMSYLGCLALAVVMALAGLSDRWQQNLATSITVELDPIAGVAANDDGRLDQAITTLDGIAGIATAVPLTSEDQLDALRPWLEDPTLLSGLPLPVLIEITLDDNARPIEPAALEAVLGADIDGLRVVDQAPVISDLLRPARIAEAFAYVILTAVFFASLLLSAFSARAALASHVRLVSLLHMIGAADRDIAREIEWHILWRGSLGALAGLLAAIFSLMGTISLMGTGWPGFLPQLSLNWSVMMGLLLFPALLVTLAVLTARFTVIRTLDSHG